MASPTLPVDPAVIASCLKPPVPPRARSLGAYPSGNVGSQGPPSSTLFQRAARFGKGTSSFESHCCANQFDHWIWIQRVMNVGTWGLRWRSWGTYSSNSFSRWPISCPNVFNCLEDVCLFPKRVWPRIRSLLFCPRDCSCEVGIVTPLEATSSLASNQAGCGVAACHKVVAVRAGLYELLEGSGVLSQRKSVKSRGQVVLSGEAEIQPYHHFQQCRCDDCRRPQGEGRGGLVQGPLQHQQLLLLRSGGQLFPQIV